MNKKTKSQKILSAQISVTCPICGHYHCWKSECPIFQSWKLRTSQSPYFQREIREEEAKGYLAAGILPIKNREKICNFFFIEETRSKKSALNFAGGKREAFVTDGSIYSLEKPEQTARREFYEETGITLDMNGDFVGCFWFPTSKYLLFVYELTDSEVQNPLIPIDSSGYQGKLFDFCNKNFEFVLETFQLTGLRCVGHKQF